MVLEVFMICPKCGTKFRVTNTAGNGDTNRYYLRGLGNKVLDWYTEDFVIRQRVCPKCKYSSVTIEVELSDLKEICNLVSEEGIPDCLKRDKK